MVVLVFSITVLAEKLRCRTGVPGWVRLLRALTDVSDLGLVGGGAALQAVAAAGVSSGVACRPALPGTVPTAGPGTESQSPLLLREEVASVSPTQVIFTEVLCVR